MLRAPFSEGFTLFEKSCKGEMFGFPRLRALVAEHGEEPSLGDFLLDKLYSFVGEGWEQEDDITLLTLERLPIRR
jgi:serine phosphatase RsbU (regulator of sigma subunit)